MPSAKEKWQVLPTAKVSFRRGLIQSVLFVFLSFVHCWSQCFDKTQSFGGRSENAAASGETKGSDSLGLCVLGDILLCRRNSVVTRKLLGTSATLVVTGALLVVTRKLLISPIVHFKSQVQHGYLHSIGALPKVASPPIF